MKFAALIALTAGLISGTAAHYTFPYLIVNGQTSGAWVNIRRTDNYQSNGPVTDVSSTNFRCYNGAIRVAAQTVTVSAGSQLGFKTPSGVSHPGVLNVYMARASNGDASTFDGSGQVWFKVHQLTATTNGGTSITWPSNADGSMFTIPQSLPSGEYLVRVEHIALHSASGFGGAQFYVSCAQVNVINGGSGTPGPLVSIPGVYTGREPGIMLNIYYPIPATYVQPGPAVWRG